MKHPPLLLYRLGHFCHQMHLIMLANTITWLNRFLFACYIPSSARIGRNVRLGYWALGIVIHAAAEIGDDCWIMQNVTIGRNVGEPGVPRIGKNVMIGAGAVIMGGIELGDHCMIGANSVVRHSFPARSVVAGAPAHLIRIIPEGDVQLHYSRR
jgi:serine O-acetyltransferase